MMSNDLLALLYFICVNVHCLNSVAYVEVVAFNDETFFFLSGSQKVYTNLDVDLSANISVIGQIVISVHP